jgi:hypothetical protein
MMTSLLFLLLLHLLGFFSTLGIAFLLIRGTHLRRFLLESTLFLFPVWVILAHTLFGYIDPAPLSPWAAYACTLLGAGLSTAVLWRYKNEIRPSLGGVAPLLCWFLSTLPALLLLAYHGWDVTANFPFIQNGEYLNYALQTYALMGRYPFEDAGSWIVLHKGFRIGGEIFLAHISYLFRTDPWRVAIIASVFFRCLFDLALIRFLFETVRPFKNSPVNAVLFILLAAFVILFPPHLFNYALPFFSSHASLYLFLPYIFFLQTLPAASLRMFILYLGLNVYFLLTYPEICPNLKIAEAISWLSRIPERKAWRFFKILMGFNALTFAFHPVLVIQKLKYVFLLVRGTGSFGYNLLGHPLVDGVGYLGALLGLVYPLFPPEALLPGLGLKGWVVAVGIFALGALVFHLVHKSSFRPWLIAWVVLALIHHLFPLFWQIANWYPTGKFYLHTSWILPLLIALTLVYFQGKIRWILFLPLLVWVLAFSIVDFRVIHRIPAVTFSYPYSQVETDLKTFAGQKEFTALSQNGDFLWVFQLLGSKYGAHISPLTSGQVDRLGRKKPVEDSLVGPAKLYEGIIAVDHRDVPPGGISPDKPDPNFEDGGRKAISLHVGELLVSREPYSLVRGVIKKGSRIKLKNPEWVFDNTEIGIYLAAPRLKIIGDIPGNVAYRFPYTFHAVVNGEKIDPPFSVPKAGLFTAVIDLPERWQNISAKIRFVCPQTFVPQKVFAPSPDSRELAFMMIEVQAE